MPGEVKVKKASEITSPSGPQSDGMERIPAIAEHQEVNDGDEEVKWIITRGGRSPIVHNLDDWGKSQDPAKAQGSY
ncbi:hypothetical protein N0V94_000663 [Neodidymelliopsis sp. IMI 364377]|nr:hypothetical protein N0V94_000663 [Neodidymelliopsis sp. IMI 364377]